MWEVAASPADKEGSLLGGVQAAALHHQRWAQYTWIELQGWCGWWSKNTDKTVQVHAVQIIATHSALLSISTAYFKAQTGTLVNQYHHTAKLKSKACCSQNHSYTPYPF